MNYSILEIANILGASSQNLTDATIDTLLTDSRSLVYPEKSLFFAIKTKSNDGHNYIGQLYEKRVRNFVVERIPAGEFDSTTNFIVVDDTLAALQALARHHRNRFDIPVIGITGSRGKTIVKEWLFQLLRDDFSIVRSPRSYNSQIGVPLSVWDIDESTQIAIIEAGISRPDEMSAIASVIDPTITVITNIGDEHSEGFNSIEEKCTEKLRLSRSSQRIVYCTDDALIAGGIIDLCYGVQEIGWSQSQSDAPLFISSIMRHGNSTDIHFTYLMLGDTITIPFTASHDIENAITCLATLLAMNIPMSSDIKNRFRRLVATGSRMDVTEGVNNCMLIHDTYTGDYLSLAPSIDFMMRRTTATRTSTIILSDVLPESIPTDMVYQNIADMVNARRIARIIGIGEEIYQHRSLFSSRSKFFRTTDEMLAEMSPSDFANELILLKGAPEYGFGRIYEMLEAKQHETVLEVNLDALTYNYNFYRSRLEPTTKIVCMLKASGYGAGSLELAKTLQAQGAAYIAVAAHDEGVALRQAGITMPIMVLNPKVVNYKALFDYRLEPEIYSFAMLNEIIVEAQKFGISGYPIHLKLDTGMHRLGFVYEELPAVADILLSQNNVRPASIFSHLCTADEFEKTDYAHMQLDYFDRCTSYMLSRFDYPIMRHILNTDGILRFPDHQYEMVRLGIGLYGIPTLGAGYDDSLRPVSALHSVIIQIRRWEKGTTIGYGCHGVLQRDSTIATIPIGYADGFNRHLGRGVGEVVIAGHRCPTVGNICMDLCMVDVSDVDCRVGDKVEIFGENITATEIADKLGTIPYEVLTSVSTRVKRIYYRE